MHDVKALISTKEALAHATPGLRNAILCQLTQGFWLLPITTELKAELIEPREVASSEDPRLEELTPGVLSLALQASSHAPVAYVSTEYFGGQGGQDAATWVSESLGFSPRSIDYSGEWPNSPISQALRSIGAVAEPGKDEFDTVGLGRYRSTERWAKAHEGSA